MIFCILNIKDILDGKVEFFQAKSASEISERLANDASEVSKYENEDLDINMGGK